MEWISIKDQIPEPGIEVILLASKKEDWIYDGDKKHYQNKQFIGYLGKYSSDDVSCVFGDGFVPFVIEEITHWMPLPEKPNA